jgi:hypothetical protein
MVAPNGPSAFGFPCLVIFTKMASNMSLCFAQEDSNYQTCPAANTYSEDALNFTEFYPLR